MLTAPGGFHQSEKATSETASHGPAADTLALWPGKLLTACHELTLHTAVRPTPDVMRKRASGVKATVQTVPVAALSVLASSRRFTSQIFTVVSSLPVARSFPSGEKAMQV